LRLVLLSGCCDAILCGNRPPPLWQGLIEHRSFNRSVECVRSTLSKFGAVSVSLGPEPEYGDARVFLRRADGQPNRLFHGVQGAKGSTAQVTVALTPAPGAVTIYMDAETRKSSRQLWRSVVTKCGVTDFGA
jgi:hypothetical protein